jgi:hypothetical protein
LMWSSIQDIVIRYNNYSDMAVCRRIIARVNMHSYRKLKWLLIEPLIVRFCMVLS